MSPSKHLKIHPDNLHQQQNGAALYLQKWWWLGPTVESRAAQSRSPPAAETGKRSRAPNRRQRWRSPALQTPAEHRRCCRSAGMAVRAAGTSSVGTPGTCKHNSMRCEHKCGALPAGQYSSQPTTSQPAKQINQPAHYQPTCETNQPDSALPTNLLTNQPDSALPTNLLTNQPDSALPTNLLTNTAGSRGQR